MATQATNVIRVEMDVGQLDDTGLKDLVGGILQTAPQSALYAASPAIQACIASLKASSTKYSAAGDTVIADQTKLAADQQTLSDARLVLVTNLVQFRGLVETTAKSAADITAAGCTPLARTAPAPIAVPSGIDIFYPKKGRGRVKVTAQETGSNRRHNAQVCLDPLAQNTWTDLDGDGRSHWLTGYKAGTVVWVRFRAVRGHEKSDWCNPVCVTIP